MFVLFDANNDGWNLSPNCNTYARNKPRHSQIRYGRVDCVVEAVAVFGHTCDKRERERAGAQPDGSRLAGACALSGHAAEEQRNVLALSPCVIQPWHFLKSETGALMCSWCTPQHTSQCQEPAANILSSPLSVDAAFEGGAETQREPGCVLERPKCASA